MLVVGSLRIRSAPKWMKSNTNSSKETGNLSRTDVKIYGTAVQERPDRSDPDRIQQTNDGANLLPVTIRNATNVTR